jgi:multidrug resistance efflux pump
LRQDTAESIKMSRLYDPSPRPPERVWLHRTQWRTVAALLLLLAAVVGTLALASGFWWATRAQTIKRAKLAAPVAPAPVAIVTIPVSAASVVEVYPVTVVPTRGPVIVVRSPGGAVAELPVRTGQRVRAGQRLALLEREQPAAPTPQPLPISTADASLARERARAETLRQRLDQLRAKIQQVAASPAAPEPAPRPAANRVADRAAAGVERARRALAAAAERRRVVDQQYAERQISRFQYHLARYRELVAEVNLRRAEEEGEAGRQALPPPVTVVNDAGAAERNRKRQLVRLEAEAKALEARLAQVGLRVAGARQRLDAPPAPPALAVQSARAPRDGTITAVWAKPGANLAPGTPLLAIAPFERPRLRVRVDRRELSTMSPGTKVTIRGSSRGFSARVGRVDRQPDGAAVVDLIPPRRARLSSDMVLVPPVPKPSSPRLPTAALIQGGSGAAVWLAIRRPGQSKQWIARRQPVRAVPLARNRVAIPTGLQPGARVIVAVGQRLRACQPIAPVELGSLTTA